MLIFCKNDSGIFPPFFSFESYSVADDENKYKANYISFVRRKSTLSFHLEERYRNRGSFCFVEKTLIILSKCITKELKVYLIH